MTGKECYRMLFSLLFQLLAWYSRDDGEVVSASTSIDVSKCFLNPTSLEWRTTSDEPPAPKDAGSLALSSAPNSFCGLGLLSLI